MFETKLKIRKKLADLKLRKSREITADQVRDKSALYLATSVFFKILILSFFALIVLFPFFYMLLMSAMPDDQALELSQHFSVIPREWKWDNYQKALSGEGNVKDKGYWFSFWLTFANVLFSIVVKLFVTMLVGYAFSLKEWRGKNFVWTIFMSLLILPEVALLAGQYYIVKQIDKRIDWLDNHLGVVSVIALPFVASIFNSLMFRNAFEAIPNRIKEVALVDGAAGPKYLFKVAIPMVMPTTLTIIILTALASWNSYLWPALVAGNDYRIMSVWLFDVGRITIGTDTMIYQNIKMAGAVLVVLPMFILYFLFRKRIMNAISRQGSTIKG